MYALYGNLKNANPYRCKVRNLSASSTWHAIISTHLKQRQYDRTLELYHKMQEEGIKPNKAAFLCILKACGSIKVIGQGRLVHDQVCRSGVEPNGVIGNTLIDMYAKCGALQEALKVFDGLPKRSVVSWSVMIAGYARLGQGSMAIELFEEMQLEGARPSKVTFLCILKACGSIGSTKNSRLIHDQIIGCGLEVDMVVGSTLVDVYAKCGSLEEAHKVFDNLENRDVVSWNAMISGYSQHEQGLMALQLLEIMKEGGIEPTGPTFLCSLQACYSVGAIGQGRLVHEQIIRRGLESDEIVGNALMDMYAKCGSLDEANRLFDQLPNVVSWRIMIAGYVQHGYNVSALQLFEKRQQDHAMTDKVAFLSAVKACVNLLAIREGRMIHDQILRSGLKSDVVIQSALIDMYAKCGRLDEARIVFDRLLHRNVVSWGAMIAGYAQHGCSISALELNDNMQLEGILPTRAIVLCTLKACSSLSALPQSRLIHEQIVKIGLELDMVVGSALVDTYAKCECIEAAGNVFDKMQSRDIVSWNAMIAGYAQHGQERVALQLFATMQQEKIEADKFTFLCILQACGSVRATLHSRLIHSMILESGLESDVIVGSSIVDMYAQCGTLDDAFVVFDNLPNQDVVSWGALIAGYADQGNYWMAGKCLEDMQHQGLKPDSMAFISVLAACSHAGNVKEGHRYFKSMTVDHGITPSIEHFNCMIDLLGHAGHLDEARKLIQSMPISPDVTGWMSLLTACRKYGNKELGMQCFNEVVQLDPSTTAGYVLMSNIYADVNMWAQAHNTQAARKYVGAWRKPGSAWIEVKNEIHELIVGDRILTEEIYTKLERSQKEMNEFGYIPKVDLVLKIPGSEHKEDALI